MRLSLTKVYIYVLFCNRNDCIVLLRSQPQNHLAICTGDSGLVRVIICIFWRQDWHNHHESLTFVCFAVLTCLSVIVYLSYVLVIKSSVYVSLVKLTFLSGIWSSLFFLEIQMFEYPIIYLIMNVCLTRHWFEIMHNWKIVECRYSLCSPTPSFRF